MPSVYIPRVSRDAYIRSVQCLYIIPPPHTRDNYWIYLARLGRLRHSWSDMGQGSNGVRGREGGGVRSPSVWREVVRFLSVSDLYEPSRAGES